MTERKPWLGHRDLCPIQWGQDCTCPNGPEYLAEAGLSPRRPLMLIVYSGQAGEAAGYVRAGFDVFCTDIVDQPRCPFPFIRADALDAIRWYGGMADLIAGGPVCKAYSKTARIHDAGHPEQIPATREAMIATGKPYVIENVEDALPELIDPVMLCGQSFGLRTYRHRLFESNLTLKQPVPADAQIDPETCGFDHLHPLAKMGRPIRDGEFYHAVGHFSGVDMVREDMGVPWMSREGINQCIPPAFSEYIGRQLIDHLATLQASA